MFYGHDVKGEIDDDGTDLRKPIPSIISGKFAFKTQKQVKFYIAHLKI